MRIACLLPLLACAGAALAQNNPPPMQNPAPPAPAIQAPTHVPPPPIHLPGVATPPAPSAISDPIARRLNLALGLAGGLRKEVAEGRASEARANRLLQQLQQTMIGLREDALAADRTAADEVWTRPQAEAAALIGDLKLKILQDQVGSIEKAYQKLVEASRKRHETAQNAIRNVK